MPIYSRKCDFCGREIHVEDAPDCSADRLFREYRIIRHWDKQYEEYEDDDLQWRTDYDYICEGCYKSAASQGLIEEHGERDSFTLTGYPKMRYAEFADRCQVNKDFTIDCENDTGSGVSGTWKLGTLARGSFSLHDESTDDLPSVTEFSITIEDFLGTGKEVVLEVTCDEDDLSDVADVFIDELTTIVSLKWRDE